jgi:hypothetical protein
LIEKFAILSLCKRRGLFLLELIYVKEKSPFGKGGYRRISNMEFIFAL